MNATSYRFPLGSLECVSLSDGSVNYPPGHLFANVPKAQVEEALRGRGLPIDYVTTPCTCLCVDMGERRVLVDMGAGKFAPSAGRLRQSLSNAGIEPAQIDLVVLTHAHPAHVGGTLDDEGQPVYANAHYTLWKDEWEFWTSEAAFARASQRHVAIARQNLEAIHDRLTLLDRESEVVPGIDVLSASGHTPGHVVVSVTSNGQRLLYLGDVVMHVLHLEHPDWTPMYDIASGQAQESRRALLDRAAGEGALAMGHHLAPFPSLGHVIEVGDGWQWQPIETTV